MAMGFLLSSLRAAQSDGHELTLAGNREDGHAVCGCDAAGTPLSGAVHGRR